MVKALLFLGLFLGIYQQSTKAFPCESTSPIVDNATNETIVDNATNETIKAEAMVHIEKPGFFRSKKLFSTDKSQFKPDPDTGELEPVLTMRMAVEAKANLEKYGSFSQVSILGTARQGKSTLLNAIMGGDFDVFDTSSDEVTSHTSGADYALELIQTENQNKSMMFVDVEGSDFQSGDLAMTYDAKLFMPILLTSEVVLLNSQQFNIHDIEQLLTFIGDRLKQILDKELGAKLGHLHLVYNKGYDESVEEISRTLLLEKKKFNPPLNPREQHMYNSRAHIREGFKSITIWGLPNEDKTNREKLKDHVFTHKLQLSKEYRKIVQKMRNSIETQIDQDNAKSFTGYTYVTVLDNVLNQINNNEYDSKISLKTIRFMVETEKAESLSTTSFQCLTEKLKEDNEKDDNAKDKIIKSFDTDKLRNKLIKEHITDPCFRELNVHLSTCLNVVKSDIQKKMIEMSDDLIGKDKEKRLQEIQNIQKAKNLAELNRTKIEQENIAIYEKQQLLQIDNQLRKALKNSTELKKDAERNRKQRENDLKLERAKLKRELENMRNQAVIQVVTSVASAVLTAGMLAG
eukprot:Pgem_evm1s14881